MASACVLTVALATVSGPVEGRPSARLLDGDLGATALFGIRLGVELR